MSKTFALIVAAGMLVTAGAFAADVRPVPPQRPLVSPPAGTKPTLPVRPVTPVKPSDVRPTTLPAPLTPPTRPTTRPITPMVRPVGPPPKAK